MRQLCNSDRDIRYYDYDFDLHLGHFKTPMSKYYQLIIIHRFLDLARLNNTEFLRKLRYDLSILKSPFVQDVQNYAPRNVKFLNMSFKSFFDRVETRIGSILYQYVSSMNLVIPFDMEIFDKNGISIYKTIMDAPTPMKVKFQPYMQIQKKHRPKWGYVVEDAS